MTKTKSLFFISLGCAKNLVDSEHMLGILNRDGYQVVPDIEKAECVVINTCGFLQEAVREAIDTILDAARFKETGSAQKVGGCRLFCAALWVQNYEKRCPKWTLGSVRVKFIGFQML